MRVVALGASFVVGIVGCAFAEVAFADSTAVLAPSAEHVRRAIEALPDGAPVVVTYGPCGGPTGPVPGYGPSCPPPCYGPPPPSPWMAPADPCCHPCPPWTFTIGAWIWGFDGTVGAKGREISADSKWTDSLENLDLLEFALDARARVEWNRWSATVQVDGATLEDSVDFHEGALDVDAEVSFWTLQADIGYTFLGGALGCGPCAPVLCVEGYAGMRAYWADLDVDSTASTVPNGVHASMDWVDPIVGARAHLEAGPWRFGLEGDVG